MTYRRSLIAAALLLAAGASLAQPVNTPAGPWPAKPVRIVRRHGEISCRSQVVEDSTHLCSPGSRLGVDNYHRQWTELCWPHPFQMHAQRLDCHHLAPALCTRRRSARVDKIMVYAPRKKERHEQVGCNPTT